MIGARDMAFPRLNAFSYWMFLLGGIVLYSSYFATGGTARAGWTSYVPLSEDTFSPGHGQDYWILALHILTISSLAGAINLIVTIHNMRTRGMTWMRMPLFVWAMETYAILLVAVLPALSAGLTLLLLDRQAGTHFFIPSEGGSAVLYQHVFWFFGHPEVYIMVLPVFGMISEIIPVFARKPIFGYKAVAFSTISIAFFSLLVWAHHMFAVGMPVGLDSFFMITSMVIAVPTGVKIFNWLATAWRGSIHFDTPMLFALGFIALFTMGGLSGIFLAAFPVDWQVTDTYYVVAHLHYVLFGGSIFGIFAGLYYWWPKMFGRMLDERLGKISFWTDVRRLQPDVLAAAHARPPRHAAPHLHVSPRRLVGVVQPHVDDRLRRDGDRHPRLRRQRVAHADTAPRQARRQRPVARRHARVVHDLAAAAAQLRRRPVRDEPTPVARSAPARGGAATSMSGVAPGPWLRADGAHRGWQGRCSPSSRARQASARRTDCSRRSSRRRSPRCSSRRGSRIASSCRPCSPARAFFTAAAALPSRGAHAALAACALAALLVVCVQKLPRRAVPWGSWRDYVALTKPRIMSLLLVTGFCGMIVGARGWPGTTTADRRDGRASPSRAAARAR